MPANRPIPFCLIGTLLLLIGPVRAAQWNCVADDQGGWACYDLEANAGEPGPAPKETAPPATAQAGGNAPETGTSLPPAEKKN